jgi:hypothetical protein
VISEATASPRDERGRFAVGMDQRSEKEPTMTTGPGLLRVLAAAAILAVGLSACGGAAPPPSDAPPDYYHYRQPFQAG